MSRPCGPDVSDACERSGEVDKKLILREHTQERERMRPNHDRQDQSSPPGISDRKTEEKRGGKERGTVEEREEEWLRGGHLELIWRGAVDTLGSACFDWDSWGSCHFVFLNIKWVVN